MNERHDDLQEIIDAALREMAAEEGDGFDPQACNLAEFCRRTGLTRSRARTVRAHGFRALPHGNSGRRAAPGVLAGHTGLVDDLLRKGVTNSQVIFERLLGQGHAGGLTTVKTYIAAHRDLVPAKRRQVAALWCAEQGGRWRRAAACVPMREHEAACSANTRPLEVTAEVERYLCPRRKISFDGFVSFEGHRYGVPYWYVRRERRVNREGRVVHIYSDDLSRELVAHAVGTGADSWCEGQWETSPAQPEELPTQPVGTVVEQIAPPRTKPGFERFDFGRAE